MITNIVRKCDYLELLQEIPDASVDLVLTDPPFGIGYQIHNITKTKHRTIQNDNIAFSYESLAKEANRILKPTGAFLSFTGWSVYPEHYRQVQQSGMRMREPLIVQKRPCGTHDLYGSFQSNSEWILFARQPSFRFQKTALLKNSKAGCCPGSNRNVVPQFKTRFPSCWFGSEYPWATDTNSGNKWHPTMKNVKLLEWLIQICCPENGIVVDPFAGSGSLVEAAINTKRQYLASEIDTEYYNQILEKRVRNVLC